MSYAYRIIREFGSVGHDGRLAHYAAGDVVVFDAPRTSPGFFEPVESQTVTGDGSGNALPPVTNKPRRGRPPKAKE